MIQSNFPDIDDEIASIQEWLNDRPSLSMDTNLEERIRMRQRIADLMAIKIRKHRRATDMMKAQNSSMDEIDVPEDKDWDRIA